LIFIHKIPMISGVYPRHVTSAIERALSDTPVVLLHGARQTGKTTLVRAICERDPSRRYVTLDDALTMAAATADPTAFVATGLRTTIPSPIAIDEVQHAPELFRAIKAEVDRSRVPGRFLLTGSAHALLLPNLSESLAGRMEIRTLWPLSQGEIEGRVETFIDDVFGETFAPISPRSVRTHEVSLLDRVVRGGFPEPIGRSDPERRRAWFDAYIGTVLLRDVREIAAVEDVSNLPRLLAMLAGRIAGLLNFADLSRSLSIPQTSLKRYFALLEATFLILRLPAWSISRGTRLAKAPKLLLCDTGLASFLVGADPVRLASDGTLRGALLECFVATELMKQREWSRVRPTLHHFRTVSGQEVDLVLEDASGRFVGIEVKSSTSVSADDFRGLHALAEAGKGKFVRGVVLHGGTESAAFGPDMLAVPISTLWQA